MAKGRVGGFLIHLIILLVLFLSLINIIFGFHAKMLMGEFLLLLLFVLIALVAMGFKLASGSSTGKKFHAPRCDWAKRIKKKSQVWFNDKEEAKREKYKACDCVR